jgi:hypothetical protein
MTQSLDELSNYPELQPILSVSMIRLKTLQGMKTSRTDLVSRKMQISKYIYPNSGRILVDLGDLRPKPGERSERGKGDLHPKPSERSERGKEQIPTSLFILVSRISPISYAPQP